MININLENSYMDAKGREFYGQVSKDKYLIKNILGDMMLWSKSDISMWSPELYEKAFCRAEDVEKSEEDNLKFDLHSAAENFYQAIHDCYYSIDGENDIRLEDSITEFYNYLNSDTWKNGAYKSIKIRVAIVVANIRNDFVRYIHAITNEFEVKKS